MMENDIVSIVIPVYNVERYVDKCIQSVLCQTYQYLEIIVVDDGSTDNSGEKCDNYLNDKRVKVFHKTNGGLSDARNFGITKATGKYILFVDSDDWISSNAVERLLHCAQKYNADIVCCEYYIVDEENNNLIPSSLNIEEKVFSKHEALKRLLCQNIKDYAWNKLYKISLFSDITYPKGRNYEDIATTYRVFDLANSIAYTPEKLNYYLLRKGSIDNEINQNKVLKNKFDALFLLYERINFFKLKDSDLYNISVSSFVDKLVNVYDYLITVKGLDKEKRKYYIEEILKYKKIIIQEYSMYLSKKQLIKLKVIDEHGIWHKQLKNFGKIYNWISFKRNMLNTKQMHKNKWRKNSQYKGNKRIFLIGTPEHDNLGDHAIAYASQKLFSSNGYNVISIGEDEYLNAHSLIKTQMKNSDCIIMQGGGNFGDIYQYIDKVHKTIFREFKTNTIVVMPQTIHYSNSIHGKSSLEQDKKLISNCSNVIFFCRDQESFELANREFSGLNCVVKYCPDIVLSLSLQDKVEKEIGCLLCLRSDKESNIGLDEKLHIIKSAENRFESVYYYDTCIGKRISYDERNKVLESSWDLFSKSNIVITDRLHGVIFSFITGTPCIAIGNFNHKVESISRMLSKYGDVHYLEDILNIDIAIDEIQHTDKNRRIDDFFYTEILNAINGGNCYGTN